MSSNQKPLQGKTPSKCKTPRRIQTPRQGRSLHQSRVRVQRSAASGEIIENLARTYQGIDKAIHQTGMYLRQW
jgi:hypothetical protein